MKMSSSVGASQRPGELALLCADPVVLCIGTSVAHAPSGARMLKRLASSSLESPTFAWKTFMGSVTLTVDPHWPTKHACGSGFSQPPALGFIA